MTDSNPPSTPEPIEPISGEEARVILEQAISKKLGPNWRDDDSGWTMVTGHDFMARMTNGLINTDFYVDLLGAVNIEEKPLNPAQASGRLVAWTLLGASLAIAFLIARIAGWL